MSKVNDSPRFDKVCHYCGRPFKGYANSRYCGELCKNAAYRKRRGWAPARPTPPLSMTRKAIRARERIAERKAAGRCVDCNGRVVKGRLRCYKHLQTSRRYAQDYLQRQKEK